LAGQPAHQQNKQVAQIQTQPGQSIAQESLQVEKSPQKTEKQKLKNEPLQKKSPQPDQQNLKKSPQPGQQKDLKDLKKSTPKTEQQKLKSLLKMLDSCEGDGTSVITILITPGDDINRHIQKLTQEESAASNIKNSANRLSVQTALRSAKYQLKQYKKTPERGLAVFVGEVTEVCEPGPEEERKGVQSAASEAQVGKKQEQQKQEQNKPNVVQQPAPSQKKSRGKKLKKIAIAVEPFQGKIPRSFYRCDKKFYTEDLRGLLRSNDDTYGFIIMDGNGALFGSVCGTQRSILQKFSVDLPRKHGRGGQSALRFDRLRCEKRAEYVKKVRSFKVD